MEDRSLRPLALGEIIDTAFKVYVRNWRPFIALVAAVVIPAGVLEYLLLAGAIPGEVLDRLSDPNLAIDRETLDAARRLLAVTTAALLIQIVASVLANAGVMRGVAEVYLGRSPSWRDSLGFAVGRLPALLATVLVMVGAPAAVAAGSWLVAGTDIAGSGALATLTLTALLLLAIWIGVSWVVAVPVLLVERSGPFRALARSFLLVRRRWWPVFGTVVTVSLIVVITGEVANRILDAFVADGSVGRAVMTIGISVVTTPFLVAVIAVLYFDLRARKERFTLARLAADIDTPPPELPDVEPTTDDWPPLPPDTNP